MARNSGSTTARSPTMTMAKFVGIEVPERQSTQNPRVG